MATQFHCSIIGQVLRLAIVGGKPHMLKFIPRMQNYIREGLRDPVLKPMADWFADQKVDLAAQQFDPDLIRTYIREDAF
jgi:aminoglycoside/choline kinase family phosphotransferase